MLSFHGENDEKQEEKGIVTSIESESVFTSINKNLFCQRMVYFVYKLDLDDQK